MTRQHDSCNDATQGMPPQGRAPCLWETPRGGCHAVRGIHTARYHLYLGRPQDMCTQWHKPPLYNKHSLHTTSSSLDAMASLAAGHARTTTRGTHDPMTQMFLSCDVACGTKDGRKRHVTLVTHKFNMSQTRPNLSDYPRGQESLTPNG